MVHLYTVIFNTNLYEITCYKVNILTCYKVNILKVEHLEYI